MYSNLRLITSTSSIRRGCRPFPKKNMPCNDLPQAEDVAPHSAVCAKRQYGWRAADFCFCERADCRYPCYPLCILALSALEALAVSRKCGEIKRNYTLSFSHSFNAAATVSSMSAYVYCASLPPNSTRSCCCASS